MTPTGIIPKWEILYGAGDVAVYNGLKKLFHVYPEEAEMVVKILNELELDVDGLRKQISALNTGHEILTDMYVNEAGKVNALQSELARCKEDSR
jgi:hypothetical protein